MKLDLHTLASNPEAMGLLAADPGRDILSVPY